MHPNSSQEMLWRLRGFYHYKKRLQTVVLYIFAVMKKTIFCKFGGINNESNEKRPLMAAVHSRHLCKIFIRFCPVLPQRRQSSY